MATKIIEYIYLIVIIILSGAVQRNGNKMHGLRRTKSYSYSILQSLCGLLDMRPKSARVPVLSDSGCFNKLNPNLFLESCCYNFCFSSLKEKRTKRRYQPQTLKEYHVSSITILRELVYFYSGTVTKLKTRFFIAVSMYSQKYD